MFKRKFARASSSNGDIRPAFDDAFWSWYVDSCVRFGGNSILPSISAADTDAGFTGPMPYNTKKYIHALPAVLAVKKHFEAQKLDVPPFNQIVALLKSPFTQGDPTRTFELIRFFQLSSQGLFLTNENRDKLGLPIQYVGAENWENVMCYLDALLFAMFANLESFEPILFISNKTPAVADKHDSDVDHHYYLINQLAGLLRVYVSLLRLGSLITTDLTMRLCEVLNKLGFHEAMSHKQQDCASLFEFLTETLSMPLLTFKIDIKHAGKFNKNDDEKYSRERILFVSIPDDEEREMFRNNLDLDKEIRSRSVSPGPPGVGSTRTASPGAFEGNTDPAPDGAVSESSSTQNDDVDDSILLEECLEHYFNNSISVKRELARRATLESFRLSGSVGGAAEPAIQPISEELASSPATPLSTESTPTSFPTASNEASSSSPASRHSSLLRSLPSTLAIADTNPFAASRIPAGKTLRTRSSTLSIWSLNEPNDASLVNSQTTTSKPRNTSTSSRRASTSKEVSLPAWMFLRLLPFYTDDNDTVGRDGSFAKNSQEFVNRRPILPICLKRYSFHDSSASKAKRRIIIPPVINLPNFVADEENDDLAHSANSFKLILESAVCHRGTSVSLGHFVSVIRKDTNNLQDTDDEALNAPWYLYDDMHRKSRVVVKTFKEIFDTEWPYMLFYRLVSNEECHSSSSSLLVNGGFTISPPPGSTSGQYWSTESPALFTDNIAELVSRTSHSLKVTEIAFSATSTPLDPRYIDIRNKYFWYVIDGEKNYYKELSIPSRHGTREPSISISPQFRRNSQWSDNSRPEERELKERDKEKEKENENEVEPIAIPQAPQQFAGPAAPQKWRLNGKAKTPKSPKELSASPKEISVLSLSLDQSLSPTQHVDTLDDPKHKSKKSSRRKRDEYKKEKCTIT